MNQPDYSKYDPEQLRQIRRSIDAERFPERVAQIEARLAELAAQPAASGAHPGASAAPPAAVIADRPRADPASYRPVMRRAAKVMACVVAVDAAAAIWNAMHGTGSMFYIDVSSLITVLLLAFGGLRVAIVLRWLAVLGVPMLALWPLMAFMLPLDLTLTQLALQPSAYLITFLLPVFKSAMSLWMLYLLSDPAIRQARALEGRKPYDMRVPLALGVLLVAGYGVMLFTLMLGERARHAEELAARKEGAKYHYHVNNIRVMGNSNGTFVSATVVVWNDKFLGAMDVSWKE
ncbi:hypothetical protein GTP81_25575 [Rugamonas sp. FT107W]|uniref:Uncharacterized protein n=1 Tax=Duganella vulcania TaxID=2692166 RepID=A0A845HNG9_9BURK|nr:hypothetical protein [Duganella vulcania]MYN20117.1 hypothetical protein [Duganella vulcania]